MFVLNEISYSSDHNTDFKTSVLVSTSRDKLEAKKAQLEIERDVHYTKTVEAEAIAAGKLKLWKAQNPAPEIIKPVLLPLPKWESKPGERQVITDEMRAERQRIDAENWEIHDAAMKPHKEYLARMTSENPEYYNRGCTPHYTPREQSWEIIEVPEI